jgi:hypothetical protein
MHARTRILAALLLVCGCAAAADDDPIATASADLGGRRFLVVPDDVPVFGRSITEWTERFWMWLSSVPADRSPEVTLDADCAALQHGPVFFIPPFQAADYERTCRVRFGKLVLVPVQAVLNSYPCPDPTFQPAPGQTLEEFLQEGAIFFDDLYANLAVTVDGQPVDIADHRSTTPLFENQVDASLLPFLHDDCLSGAPQPAVGDGWYLVILFAPGPHRVAITALNPGGQPVARTYDIDVKL